MVRKVVFLRRSRRHHLANVGVVGAGSWGTALALVLEKNGHQVTLWSSREAKAEELRTLRENADKLPGVKIPETMAPRKTGITRTGKVNWQERSFSTPTRISALPSLCTFVRRCCDPNLKRQGKHPAWSCSVPLSNNGRILNWQNATASRTTLTSFSVRTSAHKC